MNHESRIKNQGIRISKEFKGAQNGQVLIISLLVLVVALTVGLSVAVRTITTTRMTTAEDSSQRAFSAAEAGLERALTADAGVTLEGEFVNNNSSYKISTSELSGDQILLDNGAFILKDDPVDVWLSDYPDYTNSWPPAGSRNLTIYWGANSDQCFASQEDLAGPPNNMLPPYNTMAALEVVLISGTENAPEVSHFAYDPCGTPLTAETRRDNNHFSPVSAGGSVAGKTFAYSATIPVTSGLLARIVPLYAGTYIGVSGTGLPPQGIIATSIGNSGGTQRKIVSFRGYPKPPIELYPFLIFSPK